jgi:lipopolysaccharide/colanic/teichoic acid biosynthesis glycosyltransferase
MPIEENVASEDVDSSIKRDIPPARPLYDVCHRTLDLVLALPLLLLITPVLLLIAVMIRVDSAGPALFFQERLGRAGKRFTIWKFRTMTDGIPTQGEHLFLQERDPRITRVGRILRLLSLDELPQLVNVIRGDMSLVGPRPPVPWWPYEFECYPPAESARFLVRPGITGYSQVIARREVPWTVRLQHDCWYVSKRSIRLYVWILWRTIVRVVSRRGIEGERYL